MHGHSMSTCSMQSWTATEVVGGSTYVFLDRRPLNSQPLVPIVAFTRLPHNWKVQHFRPLAGPRSLRSSADLISLLSFECTPHNPPICGSPEASRERLRSESSVFFSGCPEIRAYFFLAPVASVENARGPRRALISPLPPLHRLLPGEIAF
jgi:hypothetical protein